MQSWASHQPSEFHLVIWHLYIESVPYLSYIVNTMAADSSIILNYHLSWNKFSVIYMAFITKCHIWRGSLRLCFSCLRYHIIMLFYYFEIQCHVYSPAWGSFFSLFGCIEAKTNGRIFTDNSLESQFIGEDCTVFIQNSLKFVPKCDPHYVSSKQATNHYINQWWHTPLIFMSYLASLSMRYLASLSTHYLASLSWVNITGNTVPVMPASTQCWQVLAYFPRELRIDLENTQGGTSLATCFELSLYYQLCVQTRKDSGLSFMLTMFAKLHRHISFCQC